MIRHVLSGMATRTLIVTHVLVVVIKKIKFILSSFFGGENNDRGTRKWGAWSKIYKHVEEGGADIRNLNDVKLWASFFRAKYIKTNHLIMTTSSAMGSQLWKDILKSFFESL